MPHHFCQIERAIVLVDEKGKSTGQGIVDYTRKNYAIAAHNFCSSKCYFITSDLRPIITELGDMSEMDEGLLEINLPKREYNKERELVYYKAREVQHYFMSLCIENSKQGSSSITGIHYL